MERFRGVKKILIFWRKEKKCSVLGVESVRKRYRMRELG